MLEKTARQYFLGQKGPRLGCAQAVAEALKDKFKLDDDFVQSMQKARGGQAPLGYCGAVYAAMEIAQQKAPDRKKEIEAFFQREAGGVTCREIRFLKKLLCADCVEHATELLVRKYPCQ